MPQRFYWDDLTTRDFAALDPQTIAILPIAATEQHGPHLPVSTDSTIANGMVELLRERLPPGLSVLVLPRQAIGKSNEHLLAPGTLTLGAELLIASWGEIGTCVRRAGLRKLLIVNSHGGNNQVMDIVARDLRVRLQMLAVTTQWNRFGTPPGLIPDQEKRYGVHAGMVETSLMLNFRPDLVRREELRDFVSASRWTEDTFKHLRATGQHNMGWMIHDLNAEGAVGNARAASADAGRAIAEHQVAGVIELLWDIHRFDLDRLATDCASTAPRDLCDIAV
jgi:creatinine amidohydrolase